ncbi:MAG: hypothetical protein DMF68_15055 [Acidobacteria bacterium]|nr:MAG: hypothetical protein DMF68_15055 [Acidobacteriota bacterium]
MTTKISPYASSVHLISPDGKFTANIDGALEHRMGSITFGTLLISNGTSYESCNPVIIWSDDSKYLAAQQLTPYMRLKVLVIAVEEKRYGYAPGYFALLEFHSFSQEKIKGVEFADTTRTSEIEIDVSQVRWK